VPKKTFNLKFPSEDSLPKEFYSSFIRGYFDGDGCIYIGKNNIKSSICGYHPFICDLFDILKKENLNVKLYINKRIESFSELYIQGEKDNIDFYNYLYDESDLFLDRKKEKFMNIINTQKGQG
jgi:intein/homing endonuclease